ncbi:CotA family spore coat protein [Terrisporobacter mayombei]|uniref:Uncharacterized protein n=1 Tax=Terrisporobacter mayombei TaxID=1541 RepID=A0ABY9QA13_9FIRM|nr:CotA family spore coat protein [Terrisporobacter mayombei]MCC3869723.1 hypothetical protein [Terrisporobacter mayombei]WMT83337.1 hypothetical protein TEMA_38480 [Terrisporobacter mayombei]
MSNNSWMVSKPCQNQEHCPEKDECSCKKDECCCKKDILKALELLFNPKVKEFVCFDKFSFIGRKYLVGTFLEYFNPYDHDNTAAPCAKLKSIDPCQSDYINIWADGFYYPIPTNYNYKYKYFVPYPVDKASLCDLEAIQFEYYQYGSGWSFKERLMSLLDKKRPFKCCKDNDCCCGDTTFRNLSFTSSNVNLTAGWLALTDAEVLGRVGNILVLSDTSSNKISYVCLESVGFYGPSYGPSPVAEPVAEPDVEPVAEPDVE